MAELQEKTLKFRKLKKKNPLPKMNYIFLL